MRMSLMMSSASLLAVFAQADIIVQWGVAGGDVNIVTATTINNPGKLPATFVAGAQLNNAVGASYYPNSTGKSPVYNGASSLAGGLENVIVNNIGGDNIRNRGSTAAGGHLPAMVVWEQSSGFVTSGLTVTNFSIRFAGQHANNTGSLNWLVGKGGAYYISSQSVAFSGTGWTIASVADASTLTWNTFTPFTNGVATIGSATNITLDNVTSLGYYFSVTNGDAAAQQTGVGTSFFSVEGAATPHTLTGSAGANGSVSPSSTNVLAGGSATFVITASNYYRIATLTTNGAAVTGMSFDNGSTTTNFTWSNVQAAGVLAATFTKQVATIEIVSVTVSNPRGTAGTDIGETNTVNVVIRSLNAPASNLTSSVSAASHPEYFTITSSNTPVVLTTPPQYVTNTFSLVANPNTVNNTYTFDVNVTTDNGVHTNTTFNLAVGSLISYQTNSIVWVSGGIFPDHYEPGEIIDITVSNRNDGALAVSNITNSLSANPAYFTISNLTTSVYPFMDLGDETSTVYRVTILAAVTNGTHWFSVTNQSGTRTWPASFSIDVFKQGVPSISPPSITMSVLPGATTNKQVTVTNSGNVAFTFNITGSGAWKTSYTVALGNNGDREWVSASTVIPLKDPETNSVPISSTNTGVSAAISIGFGFPFYGTTYSNFYVTADGYIGLGANIPARSVDRKTLPSATNEAPLIAPFWGILNSPAGSIRMGRIENNHLVISYDGVSKETGGSNLQFQVALFANGCIEFRYKNITGVTSASGLITNVTIGIQGDANSYTNLTAVKPVNGTSVLLTPQQDRWISYTPSGTVSVGPQSSQGVTFMADASGKTAGTSATFNAVFNWSTGGSSNVSVTATVDAATPIYSAVSNLAFTGLAGQVTSVPFIITNTGTGPLTFTISDSTALAAGYSTTNPAYSWIDIPANIPGVPLNDPDPSPYITAADEGFSSMIPIGFVFPFYGGSYTQLCISVNGALRLDAAGRLRAPGASTNSTMQIIAPYWGELGLDENATLKYHSTAERLVVTWENVQQYGVSGGSNQTFQAVLKPSGDITFQYKYLDGIHWPNTTIGLRDTASRTLSSRVPRTTSDYAVVTNQYGRVSTQYVNAVGSRAVQFQFAQIQTIRYNMTDGGTIEPGDSAEVTITGDASNQTDGNNSITNNTTLTVTHNASNSPASLAVTFTVTNSQETVFVRAASSALADGSIDSDGDGVSDDLERIAGTDPQNADSVFTPTIGRDSSGTFLSWPAPLDGVQRNYTLYFTTNLMSLWEYLYTVTNGVTYLDTKHSNVPAIYYKITVPMQ